MSTFEMEALRPTTDQYCIYLRKSRQDIKAEEDGEEETLARHKKILLDLAVRRGFYIGQIYQEVVSGETIKDRPEIQKMITDCYAGKWKGILIVEVTRLSRGNQGDAQTIMDCLKYSNRNNGVLVITPTKVYDVAHSQEDEEFMEFELFMSRREYKMIQKRMDRGRKQAVVEGNFMASYRPYGYDILKTKSARTLVPNPDEAPIVQLIFQWAVTENLTPYKIAQRLTAMGVPTYTGEGDWAKETVKTILMNPTYIGKVRWNDRMTVKTMVDGQLVTSRPRSNHTDHFMLYDGKHKKHALVDEETFNAVGKRFHSDKTKANLKLMNPLAGLFMCAKCHRIMHFQRNGKKKNVQPRYVHKAGQTCNVKSVMVQDVMNAIVHCLQLYIDDFQMKVDNSPDCDENAVMTQINTLQKEAKKIEKKLDKLFNSWEEGIITNNEFVERKAIHTEKLKSIDEQIIQLENTIPEKEIFEEKIMGLSDALGALMDDTLDADVKNVYLKQIIDRIEYSRENGEEFILDVFLK